MSKLVQNILEASSPDLWNLENAANSCAVDWSVDAAIAEITQLWRSTNDSVETAREALYNFLGATYEHSGRVSTDATMLRELRLQYRNQFTSDAHKKRAEKATAEEILLAMALGIEQRSLRSKYKALLLNAAKEKVARNRKSFESWLRSTGGIVKALQAAVAAPSQKKAVNAPPRTFESYAGDIQQRLAAYRVEETDFAKETHKGFALVLYFRDPTSKKVHRIAELNDQALVEKAVQVAGSEDVQNHASAVAA